MRIEESGNPEIPEIKGNPFEKLWGNFGNEAGTKLKRNCAVVIVMFLFVC